MTLLLMTAWASLTWIIAAGQTHSTPQCRTYSAEEVRTLTGVGSGTIEQTCHFDHATYERVCTIRSRINAGSFELNLTDTYLSVGDFVDEIRVIPPIAGIRRQTRRFVSGPAANADLTYEYDTAHRQTRISTNMNGNLMVTTYNTWDAQRSSHQRRDDQQGLDRVAHLYVRRSRADDEDQRTGRRGGRYLQRRRQHDSRGLDGRRRQDRLRDQDRQDGYRLPVRRRLCEL
jgi:hypothetical protein